MDLKTIDGCGRLHNWGHAFAIVDWFDNGEFKVEVEITDGKTMFGRTIITSKSIGAYRVS